MNEQNDQSEKPQLLPCPFCGGQAVECWERRNPKPLGFSYRLGFSYSEGYASANIACGKCGVRGRSYTVDCGSRNVTDADVEESLKHARIFWGVRRTSPVVEHVRNVISKHARKQDREDRSLDWNLGFNECCQFILEEMLIAEQAQGSNPRESS